MSEVFVHVGLHKTGTTWIQEEIFRKLNVAYTRRTDLLAIPCSKGQKKIIAHEELSGHPYYGRYEDRFAIADAIGRLFPSARIIVGFRDPSSWVKSLYSQYIRTGGWKSFEHFEKEIFDERFLQFEEYERYLKKKFDNVFVYRFEEIWADKSRFAKSLCDFLGEPAVKVSDKKYRSSLKGRQKAAISVWNYLSQPLPERLRRFVRGEMNRLTGGAVQKLD